MKPLLLAPLPLLSMATATPKTYTVVADSNTTPEQAAGQGHVGALRALLSMEKLPQP